MNAIVSFIKDEEGVTAIEYGLLAALIALVIVGGVIAAGGSLNNLFSRISACLASPSVLSC